MFQQLLTALARAVIIPAYTRKFGRFAQSLSRAPEIQRDLVLKWVHRCRDTQFGRDHGFGSVRTLDDYRRQVPVARYDAFAPYINAVGNGQLNALFPSDERVDRFTITTGSTGQPKLNPVTTTWLKEYRAAWTMWGAKLLADHPQNVGGKILQIIGSYDMGRTPAGIPISMVSALLARNQNPAVRPYYAIPNEVTDIPDPLGRYYATLRLALPEWISLIVLMNPGSLIRLAELGNEHRAALIKDIHDGSLSTAYDIPAPIRAQLMPRLRRPNPTRARELEQIIERTGALYPKDYWLKPIIACWLGGTAGHQSRYLETYFGETPKRDLGLVSSEGRHTIPYENTKPQGVLSINTGFYEFIPVSESQSAQPVVLQGHELKEGTDYDLVITTYSGYHRFNIGDVVRCQGFLGQAPILEFLQKGDRCGDLEGEKVTEHQFLDSASEAASRLGLQLKYVSTVPLRPPGEAPYYAVIAEASDVRGEDTARRFLEELDRRLISTNFLYSARRREGVLGGPRLHRIPDGGWESHIQAEITRRGTGEAHYKHPGLVQDPKWLESFDVVDTVSLTASSEPAALAH